jgi:hypothetical protein
MAFPVSHNNSFFAVFYTFRESSEKQDSLALHIEIPVLSLKT